MKTVSDKRLHELVDESFDDQIEMTKDALRIRSVLEEDKRSDEHPFGPAPGRALSEFLAAAERLGFVTKNIDNYAGYAEMGSGDLIGILAHLDVVPEGKAEDWAHLPYEAVVEDGRLYGRGAIDDKGPAVSALYAMKALRDSGAVLKKRFRLILGLDEESGSRCIERYKETEEIPSFSFSPDASFPVVNAEKGTFRAVISKRVTIGGAYGKAELAALSGGDRFNVVPDEASAILKNPPESVRGACEGLEVREEENETAITARGKAAHAMEPGKGDNAVQKLLACLSHLALAPHDRELIDIAWKLAGKGWTGDGLGIACADKISGYLTCNVAAIDLTTEDDGATKELSLKIDVRYPVAADYDKLIGSLYEKVSEADAELTVIAHKPPLFVPESHEAVKILLDAYEVVTGERPAPLAIGGGTYCRYLPNAVSAGPVFPNEVEMAHQTDEFALIENLRKCTHIYAEALARFNAL